MRRSKFKNELLLSVILAGIYLFLRVFRYHLEKYIPGISFVIITKFLFYLLIIAFAVEIFKIFRRRSKSRGRIKLRAKLYLPAVVLLFGIVYRFSPVGLDSEMLESKTVVQGCFDGINLKATIQLRQNKKFEIKWVENGIDDWYMGTYTQKKDTFVLIYDDKIPDKFGSTILKTPLGLVCLDDRFERKNNYVLFTLGLCKGFSAEN